LILLLILVAQRFTAAITGLFSAPAFQPLRVTAARRHEFFSNLSAALEMLHCLAGGFCVRRIWAI